MAPLGWAPELVPPAEQARSDSRQPDVPRGAVVDGAPRICGRGMPALHRGAGLPPPGRSAYAWRMCRNIRTLYNFDPPASQEEVRAAALQYVRKISGFSKPSRANEEAFVQAVDAVARASHELLDALQTTAEPKNREAEAAKARARAAQRYAA